MPRPLHNHFMTSTIWDAFPFRADDIIIATTLESGIAGKQQFAVQPETNKAGGRFGLHIMNNCHPASWVSTHPTAC